MNERESFVSRYGNVYEQGVWVAERAWDGGVQPGEDLAARFAAVVERAGRERQRVLAAAGSAGQADGAPDAALRAALDAAHRTARQRLAAIDAPPEVERERVALSAVRALTEAALANAGADTASVRAIADTVCAAERDGSQSHGLFRVPGYVAAFRAGTVNPRPVITLREDGPPGAVLVDGGNGFASLAYARGLPALAGRAEANGVAVLALKNTFHLAAMWPEVEWLAERGLAAFACTANFAYLAPHGGRRPVFGTNPIAFAYPYEPHPVVFDFASAAMARGEILVARRDGRSVPPGVGIDREGRPTTDPAAILEGAQLPFGGHKGSAIALMVELLAGGVVGDVFSAEASPDASGAPPGGVFVLALAPDRIGGPGTRAHAKAFLDRLAAEPGVRLPGARRHARRERTEVDVPVTLLAELRALAAEPDR